MHVKFSKYFCDPLTLESLTLFPFESDNDNVISGIFVNPKNGMSYPLHDGVPVFLPNSFSLEFQNQYKDFILSVKKEIQHLNIQTSGENKSWSFSLEWDAHSKLDMQTTWGLTFQSRYEQFLLETQSAENELSGKIMLDAGCGNGLLTEYFAGKGLVSIGIDFSTSVFVAEKRRISENCCFIRGDLMRPPFLPETFDLVYSNGVLHHTPSTETTFKSVAKTIKKNGRFYMWLYSQKGTFYWRFKRKFFDYLRIIICRMPDVLKKLSVQFIAFLLYVCYLIAGKKLDKNTLLIDIYDSVTPRWRYYHTPEEVSRWFYEAGFGPLSLTSWDTKYGFGAVAVKTRPKTTPGEHFVSDTGNMNARL